MRQLETEAVENYFLNAVDQFLQSQTLMVRAKWEPLLTADLADISELSWSAMRRLFTETQAKQFGDSAVEELFDLFARACAKAAKEGIAKATSHLTEMVELEGAELGDALSLGGLAGNAISPQHLLPDPAHALAQLAGGHALEAAVTRSLADFLLRVRDELERTRAGQAEPADLPQRLEVLAASWRSRLEAVGRTAVHAAFNRTKLAVGSRFA